MKTPFQNLSTPYTELHRESCALLVIDVQNDYGDPGGAYPIEGVELVIPEVVRVIEVFRIAKRPIVHVARLYNEDGSNVDMCRKWQFERGELRAVVPDTWGSQLVTPTNPTGADLDVIGLLSGKLQELTHNEVII